MKLNNKGFAISTIMYIILVLAVILITLSLSMLSSRRLVLDKIKQETLNNIYDEPVYVQVYKPLYYWYGKTNYEVSGGFNEEKSETPPTGHDFYIGLDTNDGDIVSAVYVCFKRNRNEYCLKGGDKGLSYKENQEIMKNAFQISMCPYSEDSNFCCATSQLGVCVTADGSVSVNDDSSQCDINFNNTFYCQ